jgi:hypothetical protein
MVIRLGAAVAAAALVVSLGAVSAFACGGGQHTVRAAAPTKVSYVAPTPIVKPAQTK